MIVGQNRIKIGSVIHEILRFFQLSEKLKFSQLWRSVFSEPLNRFWCLGSQIVRKSIADHILFIRIFCNFFVEQNFPKCKKSQIEAFSKNDLNTKTDAKDTNVGQFFCYLALIHCVMYTTCGNSQIWNIFSRLVRRMFSIH